MDILFSAQVWFEPDLATAGNRFSIVSSLQVIIQSQFVNWNLGLKSKVMGDFVSKKLACLTLAGQQLLNVCYKMTLVSLNFLQIAYKLNFWINCDLNRYQKTSFNHTENNNIADRNFMASCRKAAAEIESFKRKITFLLECF